MKMLGRSVMFFVATAVTAAAFPASAHPGGLNAEGCHNNRSTGDYHCHRPTAPNPANSDVVKKSRTGICHAPGTRYYVQTQNFTSYPSLQACLDSGGRLPR